MWGTRVPFSAFFRAVETKSAPVVAYSIKLPKFISLFKPWVLDSSVTVVKTVSTVLGLPQNVRLS